MAVADERHRGTGDIASALGESLHVGKQLAGMEATGHAVDDRHGGSSGEAFHPVVVEGADHHRVDHFRENPRGILNRFAASELGIPGADEQRVSTELVHADLERDAGPGGTQLEDHGERPALERLVVLATAPHVLEHPRAGHDSLQLVRAEVRKGEEVTSSHADSLRFGS